VASLAALSPLTIQTLSDLQKSDLPEESFDVHMLNFGYMLMPDPDQALAGGCS
jgi:hypothetical protein